MPGTLSGLNVGPSWREFPGAQAGVREYCRAGSASFGVRRSVAGPLRDAYPVGLRDVEVCCLDVSAPEDFSAALRELSTAILLADPRCRRVIFSLPSTQSTPSTSVELAGFRYVTDVEIPGAEFQLFVKEPLWVTEAFPSDDYVPES